MHRDDPIALIALIAAAEDAVLMSGVDPEGALRKARDVLSRIPPPGPPTTLGREPSPAEAASVAHRALALAARELGDLMLAEEHLQRGISLAAALPWRAAQARLSLVTVRTERGRPVEALAIADLAEPHLTTIERAKLGTQRAVALVRLGRHREAVAQCDHAIGVLSGVGPGSGDDRKFLAGALLNRGLAHVYESEYDRAEADLSACVHVADEAGLDHLATLAQANLPFVAARRGDIPAAFAAYRAAEDKLAGCPERLATMQADLAEALVGAHHPGEARALLALALPELEAAGSLVALAEARLLLARVELLTGDPHQALAHAERALGELTAQSRETRVPIAREIAIRARLALITPAADRSLPDAGPAAGERLFGGGRLLAEALECAAELEAGAHLAAAAALRLTAAELALRLGDGATAREQLDRLTEEVCPATAEGAAGGPPGRARGTARQGTGAEGAPETAGGGTTGAAAAGRTGSEGCGARTARSRLADPRVLVRRHAQALRSMALGDDDGAFAAILTGLAEVGAGIASIDDVGVRSHAARAGERLAAQGVTLALRGGRACAVLSFAERWRAVTGGGEGGAGDLQTLRAALAATSLGETALVEFVRDGDELAAVVVTVRDIVLLRLGAMRTVAEATVRLRYALRRAVGGDESADSCVTDEAALLQRLLFAGAADRLGKRPLIIVPASALYTLPWSVLPMMRGRPLWVTPSATAWLAAAPPGTAHRIGGPCRSTATARSAATPQAARSEAAGTAARHRTAGAVHGSGGLRVVAMAGPGLEHAGAEITAVLDHHPGAVEVPARAAEVLSALDRADVAHLAAHGTFCSRSPLLSSIELADGPLMAYDLLRLRTPPRLVVLSACDAGMAHAPAEGAPLGLAGTLLAQGTTCVVAGLLPVRDDQAPAFMALFHELVAAGHPPARALAVASEATGVRGFLCFGAGDRPVVPPAESTT